MSAARSPARTLADWTARGKLISIRDILCLRRQPRKRPQDGLDVSGKTREPKHGPSPDRKRPEDGLDVSACRLTPMATGTTNPETTTRWSGRFGQVKCAVTSSSSI